MIFLSLSLQAKVANKTETVTYDVSLHCDGCKERIEKNISWEKGVKQLNVDLAHKQVTIKYDPNKNDKDRLKKAIEKLGYDVEIDTVKVK